MLLSALICAYSMGFCAQVYNSVDNLTYKDSTFSLVYTGLVKVNDDKGNLSLKVNVLNGQLHGSCYYYYPSGKLMANMHFKNNMLEGVQTRYYESGKVYTRENYLSGKLHGYNVRYYENGKIKEEGNLIAGTWQGKYTRYNEAGIVLESGYYKNNQPVGRWIVQTGEHSVRTVEY